MEDPNRKTKEYNDKLKIGTYKAKNATEIQNRRKILNMCQKNCGL